MSVEDDSTLYDIASCPMHTPEPARAPVLHAPNETGADIIVNALVHHGVEQVFIFPGGTIAPILDIIEKKTAIKIICTRNEQGAGYAALSYAALTGKPAVFMVTSGPGVTNAITPIADAYYDNIPLILLTGQVGTGDMRGDLPVKQRGFQECDTVELMKPVTKAAFLARDARELPDLMEQAFFLANTGRKGPVVIDLPMNVQRESLPAAEYLPIRKNTDAKPILPTQRLKLLAEWLAEAERPIILAGGGAVASGAEDEIRLLAKRLMIPVTMSLPAMGVYPTDDELSLGLVGYAGSQYANLALHNADLVIGIGTTFHVRQTGSLPKETAPGARIARIDIDVGELSHSRVPLDLAIMADAKEAVAALIQMTRAHKRRSSGWLATIRDWKKLHPLPMGDGPELKPQAVIAAADRILANEKVIVTTGVGQHQVWAARHFSFDRPERILLTSSGHGTMGYDLPAAIGAKIAHPEATVICFVGDGSFQMNIQELAAIVEMKLDIKIVVLDNHALNIVAQFQRQNWQSHPSTGEKFNPDFAAIAKAYGIHAVSIASPKEMKAKLAAALTRQGPVLVHCHVDPREDLLPMLLGGHKLDDMTLDSSFE